MVEKQITLTDGTIFNFDVDKNNWCRLSIVVNGEVTRLGADTTEIIFKKLNDGLSDFSKKKKVGKIEEIDVIWIISLSEEHFTLYYGENATQKLLFIQNADGVSIAKITLTNSDIQRLKELL